MKGSWVDVRGSVILRITPLVVVATLPLVLACDSSPSEPKDDGPVLSLNEMAVRVEGALTREGVYEALGGYQHVVGAEGNGVFLQSFVGDLPLVIHIPGDPTVGKVSLGRWSDAINRVRQDTVFNVVRKPSISFGEVPAATFGHYNSVPGGVLEIEEIEIPPYPNFFEEGSIRGRLKTRAVLDEQGGLLDPSAEGDTIDLVVEFWVSLEVWPDGRASVEFVEGALAGEPVGEMIGSGSVYYLGSRDVDPTLVLSFTGPLEASGERFWVMIGSKLRAPGEGELIAVPVDSIAWRSTWREHFVIGRIGDRAVASVSGTLELDAYEPHGETPGDVRWTEAEGRVRVELLIEPEGGEGEPERTTAEIRFNAPVGFIVTEMMRTTFPFSEFGRGATMLEHR